MRYSFGFASEALLKDVFLGYVERFKLFGIHNVLWTIFHKLDLGSCLNWNEVLVSDLLTSIIPSDQPKQALLQVIKTRNFAGYIIIDVEGFLLLGFHLRFCKLCLHF